MRRPNAFHILYEDNDLIVVDKQAGVLSVPVPGGGGRNVFSMLMERAEIKGGGVYIVHRIDRYTSGLLVFAKHPRSREKLLEQFQAHTPQRKYKALVWGALPERGTFVDYLRLNARTFLQEFVKSQDPGAEQAELTFETLEQYRSGAEVEITLVTGLKNQIRAQFAHRGFPLVGEHQYRPRIGRKDYPKILDRQGLHASELVFLHPRTGRELSFEAQLPKDYTSARSKLRRDIAEGEEAKRAVPDAPVAPGPAHRERLKKKEGEGQRHPKRRRP